MNDEYDIKKPRDFGDKRTLLNSTKAKIVRLNTAYYNTMLIDTTEQDVMKREAPSLHHLLKGNKRRKTRTIHLLYDDTGTQLSTSPAILRAFAGHFTRKYATKTINNEQILQLLNGTTSRVSDEDNEMLENIISTDDLHHAIKSSKARKSPGLDGIPLEFYKYTWNTIRDDLIQIINEMYIDSTITEPQKYGIICCIPKKDNTRHTWKTTGRLPY
jgi:hypothetical protein